MLDVKDGVDEDMLAAITHNVIDQIKKLREDGLSWDKITKKVVKTMKTRVMTPYIIYENQICGYPGICEELAEVVFFNELGGIFTCPKHYKEAARMMNYG